MLIIIEKFAFDNNAMMKNYIPHEENMVARTAASYFMLSLTIHLDYSYSDCSFTRFIF